MLVLSLECAFSCLLLCLVISLLKTGYDVSGNRNWGKHVFCVRPYVNMFRSCAVFYVYFSGMCQLLQISLLSFIFYLACSLYLSYVLLLRECLHFIALLAIIHCYYTVALLMWWLVVREVKCSLMPSLNLRLLVVLCPWSVTFKGYLLFSFVSGKTKRLDESGMGKISFPAGGASL